MSDGLTVVVNGERLPTPATVQLDGQPAVVIPLAPGISPADAVTRLEKARVAAEVQVFTESPPDGVLPEFVPR